MVTLDELLQRDQKREDDGFKRKIRIGKIVKPSKGGKEKIIVVPTTVEEKFVHDIPLPEQEGGEGGSTGGTGEGEEGEVVGEEPLRPSEEEGEGEGGEGPGEGTGGEHELESNAYELGKTLSEDFDLPNLTDKGKKRVLSRYKYDLTDKNRGVGQVLDKKATLKQVVQTNICLGNIPDVSDIDPTSFIITPRDLVYRILSREKDFESQAIVFFVRDYSGSMGGKSTQVVVSQHVMLYSWLLYQYEKQVETRFILHDTEAREVEDFYKYYSYKVAGGTKVVSGYRMVNEIVEKESLARDYNIYIFHGTDGDDWDTDGKEALIELEKMLGYASRIGISIVEHSYSKAKQTEVEQYLKKSGLLEKQKNYIKMDVLEETSDDSRIVEGIKKLIS